VKHRAVLYRRLCLAVGIVLLLGVSLAAQGPATSSEVVTARRVDIVNDAGQVVWRAEAREAGGTVQMWNRDGKLSFTMLATPLGGHLEILNSAGQTVFSIGKAQTQNIPTHWERHMRIVDQQQQELVQLGRRMSAIEQLDRSGSNLERHVRATEDMRRELDQQRRELDQQRRLIDALERQVRSLERR
jgi:hypothetical protein